MSAPQVDWRHEARTLLAAGFGQRETARKLGIPEERVKKWAQRSGVAADIQRTLASVPKMSPSVPTAAQIIVDSTKEDAFATRSAFIRRSRVVVEAAAARASAGDTDQERAVAAQKALLEAPDLLAEAKILQASNAPGFERKEQQTGNQVINIALLGVDPATLGCGTSDSPLIETEPDTESTQDSQPQ